MVKIKVPHKTGELSVYSGHERQVYVIEGGEIAVDDAHVAAILASVSGSELAPEAPAKKEK